MQRISEQHSKPPDQCFIIYSCVCVNASSCCYSRLCLDSCLQGDEITHKKNIKQTHRILTWFFHESDWCQCIHMQEVSELKYSSKL